MLIGLFLLLLLQTEQSAEAPTIRSLADSGRCADLGETPDVRIAPVRSIPPGAPPLLSFRFYEGKLHGRYSNQDLLLDDAGH